MATNEIDELMSRDPLGLSDRDLDAIVAYHRNMRASADAKSKAKPTGPGPKIDVMELMGKKEPAKSGGGIRRL